MANKKTIDFKAVSINKLVNLIPGTLVYRGNKTEKFTIELFAFDQETVMHEMFESCDKAFVNALKALDETKIQWINVSGIANIEEIHKVGDCFGIDQLVLEQILNVSKHSLYKIADQYMFNDIQMIQSLGGKFIYENISFYIYDNIILTFQERSGDVFDSIRDRIKNNSGHIRNKNIDYTYFCMLDALIDHYIHVLDEMKLDIEQMEIQLMENQSLDHKDLHRLRKQIMLIRISGTSLDKLIYDLLNSNREGIVINKEYFESIYQHIRLVNNEISIQKETVNGLYENYMMTNANDMNHVMTILTIFSAIFIPLSFLAGVFGMNFDYIPGLDQVSGFYYFIIGCFVTAVLMVLYFKRKKWF